MEAASQPPDGALTTPADADELSRREAWFTRSPNPWREITQLEHGGDRTFASTVQQMVVNANVAQRPEMEMRLLAALADAELTDAGRQFICRMLGLIGSSACVPVAAALLQHDRTADDARLALDSIEDPGVDAAYREALGQLRGRAKAGLIGSIAVRGDQQAVDALTAIALDEKEPMDVRAAAERAVERLVARQTS